MYAQFNEQEIAFRDQVRIFFQQHFTTDLAKRLADYSTFRYAFVEWQKIIYQQGWIAPNWPVEYGGTGWSATQKYIFENELAEFGAPDVLPFGLKMVGPVIYTFGTEEQKKRFLPGILTSDVWWCQGYSEPGAGSDLSSLKTQAARDGDDYVVNGAKIWTTYAQYADWIFCLVRTDNSGKSQQGITFLLIDMKTPGIQVNPIISIDGNHSLNEVVFENVRVPIENRIGDENNGWTYAKSLLTHERTTLAGVAFCKRLINRIKQRANEVTINGDPLIYDKSFQQKLSALEIELLALEFTELRLLATVASGGAPGLESSLLKIKGTELQQSLQNLQLEIAGYYGGVVKAGGLSAVVSPGDASPGDWGSSARRDYMYGRASTIYGGSNEVQKNIIAKYVLGL